MTDKWVLAVMHDRDWQSLGEILTIVSSGKSSSEFISYRNCGQAVGEASWAGWGCNWVSVDGKRVINGRRIF